MPYEVSNVISFSVHVHGGESSWRQLFDLWLPEWRTAPVDEDGSQISSLAL